MSLAGAGGAAYGASIRTTDELPEHHWVCPNCGDTHVTHEREPHTPFHPCRGLRGVLAPFIADGTKAKIFIVERGDYVGKEIVTTDDEGRPVMSVITVRDDGQDCAIMAPTAQGDLHGLD